MRHRTKFREDWLNRSRDIAYPHLAYRHVWIAKLLRSTAAVALEQNNVGASLPE